MNTDRVLCKDYENNRRGAPTSVIWDLFFGAISSSRSILSDGCLSGPLYLPACSLATNSEPRRLKHICLGGVFCLFEKIEVLHGEIARIDYGQRNVLKAIHPTTNTPKNVFNLQRNNKLISAAIMCPPMSEKQFYRPFIRRTICKRKERECGLLNLLQFENLGLLFPQHPLSDSLNQSKEIRNWRLLRFEWLSICSVRLSSSLPVNSLVEPCAKILRDAV